MASTNSSRRHLSSTAGRGRALFTSSSVQTPLFRSPSLKIKDQHMKSPAYEDSSEVSSVGALIVEEEIGKENKQDDEENDQQAELRSVYAPENSKTPPEATVQVPKVIDQNEHVELDVAALESSRTVGRPGRKAVATAISGMRAVAALEKSKMVCSRAAPGCSYPVPQVTEQNEHVEIDVDAPEKNDRVIKMAKSMEERLASRSKGGRRSCPRSGFIHQVPTRLREADKDAYEPKLISIGPYHRGKGHLQPMEEQKLEHLRRILSRNKRMELDKYMMKIVELEQQTRKYYASESISNISSDDFVDMMLLDGCFLVEIFLQNTQAVGKESEYGTIPKIYQHVWLLDFICHDMMLLENQLPYFVLNCIFRLVLPRKKYKASLAELVLPCFRFVSLMPLNEAAPLKKTYHHLLHLFHHHCLPHPRVSSRVKLVERIKDHVSSFFFVHLLNMRACTTEACSDSHRSQDQRDELQIGTMFESRRCITRKSSARDKCLRTLGNSLTCHSCQQEEQQPMILLPQSVEKLEEAGITIKLPKAKPDSFLSIEFQKCGGVIRIPYLSFGDGLHSVFQNLVAFEQCTCSDADAFFVGYVLFMDCLISSGKDVDILRRRQVLDHGLGSDEECAQVFNRMSRGFFWSDDTPLADLHDKINHHSRLRLNQWGAYFTRNYCNTPCATISLLAAVVLLILTAVQTYFSILGSR